MTRRTLLTLTLSALLAGASVLHAQSAADQKTAEAVKALDQKRFDAMTKNDLAALGAMLADDLVYHHSNGAVDTKAAYIETLRTGKTRYHTVEPSEVKVRVYGNTAVVTGLAKVAFTADGKPVSTTLRYTDVWVQKGKDWQMVSWQSTRMP